MNTPSSWLPEGREGRRRLLGFAGLCIVATFFEEGLRLEEDSAPSLALLAGLLVGFLGRLPQRHWPLALGLGATAKWATLAFGGSFARVSWELLAASVAAVLANVLSDRASVSSSTPDVTKPVRDVRRFVMVSAVLIPLVVGGLWALGEPEEGFWFSWLWNGMSLGAGIVAAAPLLVFGGVRDPAMVARPVRRQIEAVLTWAVLGGYAWFVVHLEVVHRVGVQFSLLPLVGWVAVRSGIPGAAMAALVVSLVGHTEGMQELRDFTGDRLDMAYAAMLLQIFAALTGVAGLLLAALLAERRRAEEESALSLSQLRSTLESSGDGLLVVDREGRMTICNQRFVEMWRLPPELIAARDDQAMLNHVLAQVAEPRKFLAGVTRLYQDPTAESFDTLLFTDGRVYERYSRPQRLENRIIGRVWSFRDVTARQVAQRAQEAEAARRRILFEHSTDGIVVVDHQLKVVEANSRFAQMLGYPPGEVSRLHVWDWEARWTRDDLESGRWRGSGGERPSHFETRHRRKNGSVFDVEVSIVATDWDALPYSVYVCRDITERKLANLQVAGLKRFYEGILESVQDGIWVAGADHRITYCNRGMVEIAGVGVDQIVGRDVTTEFPVETTGEFLRHYWKAVETLRPRSYEARVVTPMGRPTWQTGWLVPVVEGGRFAGMICTIQDQTERLETARQIKDRETQYRAVVETSADGFMVLDGTGRVLEANAAYVRFSGYSREELLTLSMADLEVPGEDGGSEFARRTEVIAEKGSDLFECDHRTKNGVTWRVEVDASYGDIAEGRWFVFVRDVRRRHRSEALLRARLRLSELSQSLGADFQPLLQATLDEAEAFTGSRIGFFHFVAADQDSLSLQAWSTRTLREACTAEGKGQHYPIRDAGIWVECVKTRRPVIHNDYASTVGRRGLPAGHAPLLREATVPVLRGDRVVAVVGVGNKPVEYTAEDVEVLEILASLAMDMVAQKQAENALRESEELYRTLVLASPDAISVANLEGNVVYTSPKATELFGTQDPERARGRSVLEWVAPSDRERALKAIERLVTEGRFSERQFRLRRENGEEFLGDVNADVVRSADGKPRLLLVITRDATERHELEARLRQAQKMEAVGQLAGGVAHDFNNILTSMIMRLELLRTHGPLAAEVLSGVQEVESEAQRAAGLIRQLLLFSRRSVLQRRRLDCNEVIENLLKMLRRLLGEHIELVFHPRAGLPAVEADSGMLEQVVMNLVVNARDAMPKGGRLRLHTEILEVTEERVRQHPERRPGRWVCFGVADNGCGIEPQHLAHIFEPFFTTKEVGHGTGLGLATVYGIVEQHRGWVEVESEPGKGSLFRIVLPAAENPAPPVPAPATATATATARPAKAPGRIPGGTEGVLLVEDEPMVRQTLGQFLRRLGYRVFEASQGSEALALWTEHQAEVEVLFTDMMMPGGLTGLDLAHRLRVERPDLRVILSSGYSADLVSQSGVMDAGIVYLPKPSPPSEVARLLRTVLDQEAAPPSREAT